MTSKSLALGAKFRIARYTQRAMRVTELLPLRRTTSQSFSASGRNFGTLCRMCMHRRLANEYE
jgi:hypothetical protein